MHLGRYRQDGVGDFQIFMRWNHFAEFTGPQPADAEEVFQKFISGEQRSGAGVIAVIIAVIVLADDINGIALDGDLSVIV